MLSKTPQPKWAAEAPELLRGLEFTYLAFFDLSGDRPIGMGVGPIPYHAIMLYGQQKDLTDVELEDFIFLVREMDQEYIAYSREQADSNKSRAPRGSSSG